MRSFKIYDMPVAVHFHQLKRPAQFTIPFALPIVPMFAPIIGMFAAYPASWHDTYQLFCFIVIIQSDHLKRKN